MIAVTHPGKLGDALYSLPAIKYLSKYHGEQVDFYTSNHCLPAKNLFEYQKEINGFFIPPNYRIERLDMGVQPWYVPVDNNLYSKIYHAGFRSIPDRPLPEFIANSIGIQISELPPVQYDFEDTGEWRGIPYIVIAPKRGTTFDPLFTDILNHSPVPVVQVGAVGEGIPRKASDIRNIDYTGQDMLKTLEVLKHSLGFVGHLSAMLVLANGFNIPRVAVCNPGGWDKRHVLKTHLNHYLITPTYTQVFGAMNL